MSCLVSSVDSTVPFYLTSGKTRVGKLRMAKDPLAPIDAVSDSSSSDYDSSNSSTTSDHTASISPDAANSRKETRQVRIAMLVVLGMLAVTAALVITMTYLFLSKAQEDEFRDSFIQQASVIEQATKFHATAVTDALESMSDTITAHNDQGDWPYVVVNNFDRQGERVRDDAAIQLLGFSPLVTYENRIEYADFSRRSLPSWYPKPVQQLPENVYRLDEDGETKVEDDNILMAPWWQTSPLPHHHISSINYNILSDGLFNFLFGAMQESKSTAISGMYWVRSLDYSLRVLTHCFFFFRNFQAVYTNHHGYDDKHSGNDHDHQSAPHAIIMTPIYDTFDENSKNLVGIIHGQLVWEFYLRDLLPAGVPLIDAVLVNSCGQKYTYSVDGPTAMFVGEGDNHDTRYDDYRVVAEFGSELLTGLKTRTYSQCFYSLELYPTKEFAAEYSSRGKITFTAILAAVFAVTAFVFFVFVRIVGRRQARAIAATRLIVSSLFPDNVRDQLIQEAEDQVDLQMKNGNHQGGIDGIQDMLGDGGRDRNNEDTLSQLYPETTVLFADIVGVSYSQSLLVKGSNTFLTY